MQTNSRPAIKKEAMSKEDALDSILLSVFASPGVALIFSAVFKRHREKAVHYTILIAAALLVVAYLASRAPITPEPSAPTPAFPPANCHGTGDS